MVNWTEIGKDLIKEGVFEGFPDLQEGIFERFHKLIPAVGDNYWSDKHSKLLLIGESNYFEDKYESISDFKDFKNWYTSDNCRLIPEEKKKDVSNWKGGGGHNNIFNSMKKVLNEIGIESSEMGLLWEAAYYNYFLRPASVTKSSKCFDKDCKEIDCQVSYLALRGIIDEIKPDIVIFVSMYSHDKFMEYYKQEESHYEPVDIDYVNHFSRACWSDPNGQQKFEDLLRKHWVKKNPKNEIVFSKLKTIHNLLINKFKEVIYKPSTCIVWDGHYSSFLYLKVKDFTFCCETNVTINDVNFWSGFYKTDNSIAIPALEGKEYQFIPEFSNEVVVENIEKLINQIIEKISKTS